MRTLILGIDAGNYKAKVAGAYGVDTFRTNICGWFERDVAEKFGEDDMEFFIDGRRGFAGSIAMHEDEFGDGATYGDTKAHDDTKIRVLLAIHRYLEKYSLDVERIKIVTGQPIGSHKEEEKTKIIDMLQGEHKYIINRKKLKIVIEDVKVSPEGTGAFWSHPQGSIVHIIDIGSGTVNCVTMHDKKHVHKSSGTMDTGMETLQIQNDFESMAKGIIRFTTKLKWKKNGTVFVCGGAADELAPILQRHFIKAVTLVPYLKREHDMVLTKPTYANAIGFYNLAKAVYK